MPFIGTFFKRYHKIIDRVSLDSSAKTYYTFFKNLKVKWLIKRKKYYGDMECILIKVQELTFGDEIFLIGKVKEIEDISLASYRDQAIASNGKRP